MDEKGRMFEVEVLAIARALWPEFEGGAENLLGRETDGVFKTSDAIFVLECTIERSKKKAEKDIGKLEKCVTFLRKGHSSHVVKGFFITRHEPTADQRAVLQGCKEVVQALSFSEFRKKLVDAEEYLRQRLNSPFGSMKDPRTDEAIITHKYIPSTIIDDSRVERDYINLQQDLKNGRKIVLLGEYGAGKSTTVYEIFKRLRTDFIKSNHSRFPIVISLRDHSGQSDPVEVLERHARSIGYPRPNDLVNGWRSGYVDVVLDGFDEIANQGWISSAKRLSKIRYRSMEIIRRFINDTPKASGILLAGRANYFDSDKELRSSLGLKGRLLKYTLEEFSGTQIQEFLKAIGWIKPIPEWMPARPLLLGYLVAQNLLEDVDPDSSLSPAAGWHNLLDKISEREAQLEPGVEPRDIRRLLESIAVIARSRPDGLGPVSALEIRDAFIAVCGMEPDDKATVLLGRLPGLGVSQIEDGSRVFIDKDFANACAGSALTRYFQHPYDKEWRDREWMQALTSIGLEVASELFFDIGLRDGNIYSVQEQLLEGALKNKTLLGDVVMFSGMNGSQFEFDAEIDGVFFPEMYSSSFESDLSRITFRHCVIQELELPEKSMRPYMPRFENCDFGQISGCTRRAELPKGFDKGCSVGSFDDSSQTTSETLKLDLPLEIRVAITVLRKVFFQRGAGRRENALFRGLGPEAKATCPDVLEILERYGFLVKTRQRGNAVYLPAKDRGIARRAREIIETPFDSEDSVFSALKTR